jgi:pimeloyl-ACP methyl ester carboxylesterase
MATIQSDTKQEGKDGGRLTATARERALAHLPLSERSLRLNGIATAVWEGGGGPPLVLLHGPGEHAAKWLRVAPLLVRTNWVIAPDLPGHGSTAPIEGAFDGERVLAWLDDLIECTCPTPPVLVGQIAAGALAARFAAAYGHRLSHLVLVDTLGLAPFQPDPGFGQALMEFLGGPTEETHDQLWSRCAHDLDAMRRRMGGQWEDLKAYNLDRARDPALHGTQQTIMEQFGFPAIPSSELERIMVPTALIWGRHDLATPLPVAEAASDRFGWPLFVIENAGDDPPMEQPDAFVETLRRSLDQGS